MYILLSLAISLSIGLLVWEGSSGPGQRCSSQSEIGEPILQDTQGIRDFSSNLPGSKEVSKKPCKLWVPLWTCAGWTGLSFRLIKNFNLNWSNFPRALSKPTCSSQKLPRQRMGVFQQYQWKHFSASSLPSLWRYVHFTPVFLWEKQWGLCLILQADKGAQADCSVTCLVAMAKNSCLDFTSLAPSP